MTEVINTQNIEGVDTDLLNLYPAYIWGDTIALIRWRS